jgi:hypothetical protein
MEFEEVQARTRLCPVIDLLGIAATNPQDTEGAAIIAPRILEFIRPGEDALHNLRFSLQGHSFQTLPDHSLFYPRNHSRPWMVCGKKDYERQRPPRTRSPFDSK